MSEEKEKRAPESTQNADAGQSKQDEPQISFFELVAPKRPPEKNKNGIIHIEARKPENDERAGRYSKFWNRELAQKYLRTLVFCICAFLVMFIANRYFGIGNGSLRNLAEENVARIIVFPHCTYELLQSDVSDYPGVIGAVAAYDEDDGSLKGYAYDMYCKGEGGEVLLTLGIRVDGTITGLSVTAHKESRGLGTSAGNLFTGSFAGRAADEAALDEIIYMDSSPETSKAIVDVVKQCVRHAQDNYGIVGHSDVALQEAVSEDIRENNTFDSPELQALLPGATFVGFYPEKGYPLKGFDTITMAYFADLNGEEYYAYDITTAGKDGDIVMSVAVAPNRTIVGIQVHSQQESAFEGNSVLEDLLQKIIGCGKVELSQLDVDGDARYSGNAIINAALDAVDCTDVYFKK